MGSTDVKGSVEIGGDSKGLVIAYKKAEDANKTLASSLFKTSQAWDAANAASKRAAHEAFIAGARLENTRQRAADLDATFGKAGTQFDRAAGSMGRAAAGAGKLAPALGFAAKAAATGSVSVSGLVGAVLSATSVLGPWGLALAAAGSAVYGLVNSQMEAAEAARLHTEELKKQKREMEKLAREEATRKALERRDREFDADQIRKQDAFIATRADDLKAIEDALAEHGRGKGTLALQKEEARILEQNALTRGQYDEAAKIARQIELRELELMHEGEKKVTQEKKEQFHWSSELVNQMRLARAAAGMSREGSDSRDFAAASRDLQFAGMRRPDGKAEQIAGAEAGVNSTLRGIDAERAAERQFNLEAELGRIEEEKAALLSLADLKFQLATTGAERDQIDEERHQIRHQANMQRIAAEGEAEKQRMADIEKSTAMGAKAAQMAVGGLLSITDARRDAIRAARLQGKTEAEAARAGQIATVMSLESGLKSLRNMAAMHAIEYFAKGIASQASTYGIPNPQSVGYFTAAGMMTGLAVGAGVAAMGAGMIGDSMQGSGSGGGGFGGAGFGGAANGSSGGSANTGPSPVDSDIPGSPTPQPRSSASRGGGTMNNFNGAVFNLYGAGGRREFVEAMDRDLGDLSSNKRRAS